MTDTSSTQTGKSDGKIVAKCCGVPPEIATNAAPELSHVEVRTSGETEAPAKEHAETTKTPDASEPAETSSGGCCCGPKS